MIDVELCIECQDLMKKDSDTLSDPICVVRMFNKSNSIEIGRTECIENCQDPQFDKKIATKYFPGEKQLLRFDVYDVDYDKKNVNNMDYLGRAEMTLGDLMRAPGSKFNQKLSGPGITKGSIAVSAEESGNIEETAYLVFQCQDLDKDKYCGAYFCIYRRNFDGSRTLAYRSKDVKNNLNPVWEEFKVPIRALCDGDKTRPFDVEVHYRAIHDEVKLIGVCQLTVEGMRSGFQSRRILLNSEKALKDKHYVNSGSLIVKKCVIQFQY